MAKGEIELVVSSDDRSVAYLSLPGHPGRGSHNVVDKQITLSDLVRDYVGPEILLDFSDIKELIGIEIIVPGSLLETGSCAS